MAITPLPSAPQISDDPATFNTKAFAWVGALDTWTTQANALGTQVDADATQVAVDADDAQAASAAAVASANYKGEWSTLTGALNIPASVSHNGQVWVLKNNLADVTLSEPGTGSPSDWIQVSLPSPGTSGNVLTSDGTNWTSSPILSTVSTSGETQSVDFSLNAIQYALCDTDTVTFSFTNPAPVSKVDLILDIKAKTGFGPPSYTQSFSVLTQENAPNGLFFKPDGTKMYVIGQTGDDVNEYSLSTAWDISTASYSQVFSVAAQEVTPQGLFFKSDGTKMYLIGQGLDEVNEYDLSTAWNVSTAVHLQSFSVAAQEINPTGLFFRPDGTKMYVIGTTGDDVNQYDLSSAWNISTAVYIQNFSVSALETGPRDLTFKPDGTKMYIIGNSSSSVIEYNLSSAWDISTAVHSVSTSVAAQDNSPQSLFFKPDGSKFYIIGSNSDSVHEYTLKEQWNLNSIPVFESSLSVATKDTSPNGLFISQDGTRMYVIGADTKYIYQYFLSIPWSISSAVYIRGLFVQNEDTNPTDIFFKSDGTKMYMVGSTSDSVREYELLTAWDISTASLARSYSVVSRETNPQGIFFKPDGTKMYVIGTTGDDVNEFDLSTPWLVTSATYVQVFSVATEDLSPGSVSFTDDGLMMYVLGQTNDRIYIYSLSTAWNVSTATFTGISFVLTDKDATPVSMFIGGSKLFVVGLANDSIYEYSAGNFPTIIFPTNLQLSSFVFGTEKNAISIVTTDGGTTYQAINVQGGIV